MLGFKACVLAASSLMIFGMVGPAQANGNDGARAASKRHEAKQATETYLGIAVADVPSALAAHLHEQLGKAVGVIVERVAANSPAQKAGLREHDVVTSFGDQRIYTPEQLVRIVRSERPGARSTIDILRDGKKQTIEVTLGEERRPEEAELREHRGHVGRHSATRMSPQEFARSNPDHNAEWERFDSMELQKTGKDRFKATISYLNDQGKRENHQFQGTREEIRKDVEKEKDLPPMERSHLLRSLNLTDQNALLPGIRFVPGEGLVIDLDALIPSQSPHQTGPAGQL